MRNEFWIISTLISVGVIGGLVYNWPAVSDTGANRQFPDSKEPAIVPEPELSPLAIEDLNTQLARNFRRGDNFLQVGNFDDALQHYADADSIQRHELMQTEDDVRLLFRLGLTHELNGQLDRAEFYYRRAMSVVKFDSLKRLIVELAQTRNWVKQGLYTKALELLTRRYLTLEGSGQIEDKLKFQIGQQLIEIIAGTSDELYSSENSVFVSPLFEVCPVNIADGLQGIDSEIAKPLEPANPETEVLEVLQNPNGKAELIVVRAETRSQSISKLISRLSTQTKLQIRSSVKAEPFLIGRTTKVMTEAVSLAVLLDTVLHPLHLIWRQDGEVIHILPEDSLTKSELAEFRGQQAIRLGRRMVINYPDNECRDIVRLTVANLHIIVDQFDSGSTMLNQMLEEPLGGELKAKAHLSLGMIEKKFERYASSVEQFLMAVDQSRNSNIQALAYANIARVQIEQNQIEPAIVASGRSLSLTSDPEVLSAAALDMARGYLVKRDLQSANRVLFEQKDNIVGGMARKLATVFGAYSRSMGTLSPIARERAVERLVVALADVKSNELSQTVDRIIVANAYMSIGLPDRAIDVLIITNAYPENEFWYRSRTFELAELLLLNGSRKAAISNYEKLATDITDSMGQRALLKLARHQLQVKKSPSQAIVLLRKLWDPKLIDDDARQLVAEVVFSEALRIMGNAYRELGDLESAVYCFSGALPNPDPAIQ